MPKNLGFSNQRGLCIQWALGTFMHYSNIYSFGRSVAQRLRVVDSTEQYKTKNNRLRQFERDLPHPGGCW